jgi:nucleotide-binding universal stress UspA family protein
MTGRAVLVGVDGSSGAQQALRWAAEEAARLDAPLTVCCVVAPVAGELPVLATHWGTDVLAAATEQVHRTWPRLPVQAVLRPGHASSELLRLSTGHQLAVVGSRGDSGLTGLLIGSVALHLVSHGRCPVVVVPPSQVDPRAPVVVGVDGSPLNRPALEYAFAAADRAGVGLVALSSLDTRSARTGVDGGVAAQRLVGLARAAVAEWAETLPHVPVQHRVVAGPPDRELVVASAGASLTVVGSRGHGAMTALLLGSVSRRLVQEARSPIAVVRHLPYDAAHPGPDRGRRAPASVRTGPSW